MENIVFVKEEMPDVDEIGENIQVQNFNVQNEKRYVVFEILFSWTDQST